MIDPTKAGRHYDLQFKQDAVELVQSGKTIVEVARGSGRLGVVPSALG